MKPGAFFRDMLPDFYTTGILMYSGDQQVEDVAREMEQFTKAGFHWHSTTPKGEGTIVSMWWPVKDAERQLHEMLRYVSCDEKCRAHVLATGLDRDISLQMAEYMRGKGQVSIPMEDEEYCFRYLALILPLAGMTKKVSLCCSGSQDGRKLVITNLYPKMG